MEKNKWKCLISSLLILLPILFGLIAWNKLPEQMTTHWGADGNADRWSNRNVAVFALPIFILIVHWFCIFCTLKDPKNTNQNNKVLGMVLWICPITSLVVSGMVYAAAFGKEMKPHGIILPLVGLMLIVMGNYLPKCKQNSTIGIRVKWTLENEENWNVTHRFCGKVWVVGGLLIMVCSFLPEIISIKVLLVLVIVLSILPIGYSFYYHKIKQGK